MTETPERSFRDDAYLDKYDLDGEADKQSSIYLYWSQKAAAASKSAKMAKLDLKIRRGELAASYRANPPAGVKTTNDVVNEYLDGHAEIRRLERDLIEAEAESEELDNGLRALQQKKDMISELVRLQLNNYFSRPTGYTKADSVGDSFRGGLGKGRS